MQPYVIVLARNTREGNQYVKHAGLVRSRTRVAFSAKSIRRARVADIHILSTFHRRPDRHALLAAVRHTRGERVEVQWPPVEDAELTPVGPTLRQLEVAHRYDRLRDAKLLEDRQVSALERGMPHALVAQMGITHQVPQAASTAGIDEASAADIAEEAAKTRKRRYRCITCGELVWNDEDPNHGPHDLEAPEPTPGSFFGGF